MKALIKSLISFSIAVVILFSAHHAFAAKKEKALPTELAALLKRAEECHHFAGEEPYDDKRADEIVTAIETRNCDQLKSDFDDAKKTFAKKPDLIKKIKQSAKDNEVYD